MIVFAKAQGGKCFNLFPSERSPFKENVICIDCIFIWIVALLLQNQHCALQVAGELVLSICFLRFVFESAVEDFKNVRREELNKCCATFEGGRGIFPACIVCS